MHRQLSLFAGPKQQQQEDDGVGGNGSDAALQMPAAEESAPSSKADKARPGREERSIHLIPLLTFLCFLILFLCSHNPSPSDPMSSGDGNKAGSRRLRMM